MKKLLALGLMFLSFSCNVRNGTVLSENEANAYKCEAGKVVLKLRGFTEDDAYKSPTLIITRENGRKLMVGLSDFPYSGSDKSSLHLIFNQDKTQYQIAIDYLQSTSCYLLNFISDKYARGNPWNYISYEMLVEKMLTHNSMYINLTSSGIDYDVEFPLDGAKKELQALNY